MRRYRIMEMARSEERNARKNDITFAGLQSDEVSSYLLFILSQTYEFRELSNIFKPKFNSTDFLV